MHTPNTAAKSPAFTSWAHATLLLPIVSLVGPLLWVIPHTKSPPSYNPVTPAAAPMTPIEIAGSGIFFASILAFVVAYWITLYKIWLVAQEGNSSVKPAIAATLSAVPVINLLPSVGGYSSLASALNRVLRKQGHPAIVNEYLAKGASFYVVLLAASFQFPGVGSIVVVPGVFIAFGIWGASLSQMAKAAHVAWPQVHAQQEHERARQAQRNAFAHRESY